MQRLICCLTLLTIFFVYSPVALESTRALSFTSPGRAARAATPEEIITLPFDTTVSGTVPPRQGDVCSSGPAQYAINYPGGATRIKLEFSNDSHPVVLVRFGQLVDIVNGHDVFDFVSGFGRTFYFPLTGPHLFEPGTYYIALRSCSSQAMDYSFQARLIAPTEANTAEITNDTSFGEIPAAAPGSCALARTQYRITTPAPGPCGPSVLLIVNAIGNLNINLYLRRDQPVAIEDGRVIADQSSNSSSHTQFLGVPLGGTFFIAIGNCSTATADYVISLQIVATPDPIPNFPLVNGCLLIRNPNGSFVLKVIGANIKAGATVMVGGVTPRKIKFIEPELGTADSYRKIRLVKKFCGGLPGNVLVTNPGPCQITGGAFCNERCPD
jgi:hypothetical protein